MFGKTLQSLALGAALGAVALCGSAIAQAPKIDESLKAYEATSGVSGNLSSVGSDTLNNLMTFWQEGFVKKYPNVKIQVDGKGSATAPPAMIEGTAQLGPMSRPMKADEIDKFEKKFGYKPTEIKVAVDALAVFVNKDNPLEKLTMAQVDAIFSKTRAAGHAEDINTWGQLGLTGDWAEKPMSLFGRNSASGTYGYFKEHALAKGDYKDTVKEQPGSSAVVNGVAEDRFGIGYSGIGYATPDVRAVPIAKDDKSDAVGTGQEEVMAGKYPLSRFLLIYVNKAPNQELDPLVGEFIKFVLSKEGQEIVVKDGYLPLNAKMVEAELKKLGMAAK